jgi:hypothetical protein
VSAAAGSAQAIRGPRVEGENTSRICQEIGSLRYSPGGFDEAGMRRIKQPCIRTAREMVLTGIDQLWVADITYIQRRPNSHIWCGTGCVLAPCDRLGAGANDGNVSADRWLCKWL